MKMKNWNDFLSEFVLRAMTNAQIIEQYTIKQMISLAREAWDAIQAAELPESEKAKQSVIAANPPDLKPSNSTELKALARTALDLFSDDAQWLAIDANGEVWAYDLKPTIDAPRNAWDNSDDAGFSWEISAVAPPADFRTELYEIDKLLSDDL